MANNAIMLWSPDTCGCVIHIAYDDTLPPASRVYTYVSEAEAQAIHQARIDAKVPNTNPNPQPSAVLCPAHASLGPVIALFNAVRGENQRKNLTLGLAMNVVSAIKLENYVWSFDKDRILQVSFVGVAVNTNQKNNIQAAIDVQFSPGLVKVN